MEKVRQKLKWKERSEWVKTGFLLGIVVGGTLLGYGLFMVAMGTTSPLVVVTSESMEPTMYRGDLLILQARAPEDIHLLDIIVYQDTEWHTDEPIVHRVVEIQVINGTYYFYTKGDNNAMQDPFERTADEIIGVVIGKIPAIGNISLFLRTFEGFTVIVILFFIILVVPELVCPDDDEKDAEEPTKGTAPVDIE